MNFQTIVSDSIKEWKKVSNFSEDRMYAIKIYMSTFGLKLLKDMYAMGWNDGVEDVIEKNGKFTDRKYANKK